jgi:cytochrome b6-f complex iron-sulfur subunit
VSVLSRRSFLDYLLGVGTLGLLASAVYPILRFLTPLKKTEANGPVLLTRDEVDKLERDRFVIVPVGNARVMVVEDSKNQLHALSAKCTHEGCTVQYVPREAVIWCACHNGHFALSGRVISGPPPRPLAVFAVKRNAAGAIEISSGAAV